MFNNRAVFVFILIVSCHNRASPNTARKHELPALICRGTNSKIFTMYLENLYYYTFIFLLFSGCTCPYTNQRGSVPACKRGIVSIQKQTLLMNYLHWEKPSCSSFKFFFPICKSLPWFLFNRWEISSLFVILFQYLLYIYIYGASTIRIWDKHLYENHQIYVSFNMTLYSR